MLAFPELGTTGPDCVCTRRQGVSRSRLPVGKLYALPVRYKGAILQMKVISGDLSSLEAGARGLSGTDGPSLADAGCTLCANNGEHKSCLRRQCAPYELPRRKSAATRHGLGVSAADCLMQSSKARDDKESSPPLRVVIPIAPFVPLTSIGRRMR